MIPVNMLDSNTPCQGGSHHFIIGLNAMPVMQSIVSVPFIMKHVMANNMLIIMITMPILLMMMLFDASNDCIACMIMDMMNGNNIMM